VVAPSFDIARKRVQKHLFIAILRVRIAGESSAKRGLQHRPSIFQDRLISADRIYVLKAGRIVQSGTYEELMEREGPFRDLAARQIA
jgi:hypothetical protein